MGYYQPTNDIARPMFDRRVSNLYNPDREGFSLKKIWNIHPIQKEIMRPNAHWTVCRWSVYVTLQHCRRSNLLISITSCKKLRATQILTWESWFVVVKWEQLVSGCCNSKCFISLTLFKYVPCSCVIYFFQCCLPRKEPPDIVIVFCFVYFTHAQKADNVLFWDDTNRTTIRIHP